MNFHSSFGESTSQFRERFFTCWLFARSWTSAFHSMTFPTSPIGVCLLRCPLMYTKWCKHSSKRLKKCSARCLFYEFAFRVQGKVVMRFCIKDGAEDAIVCSKAFCMAFAGNNERPAMLFLLSFQVMQCAFSEQQKRGWRKIWPFSAKIFQIPKNSQLQRPKLTSKLHSEK